MTCIIIGTTSPSIDIIEVMRVKTQDTYKEVRTFEFPGMTARVHIPDLTSEERSRRMVAIHNQAANLLKKVK